jgi:NTE family protein
MAMFAPGEQDQGASLLESLWLSMTGNDSVYVNWLLGPVEALLGKGGLYDTTPLRKLLTAHFDPKKLASSGVSLWVGTVSLSTGQVHFGPDPSGSDPIDWVMASAAFPGAFPPVVFNGDHWIDGGVRQDAPIEKAIEIGATELDIVLAEPEDGSSNPWDLGKAGNAVLVGLRAADILANQVFMGDQDPLLKFTGPARVYAPYAPWDSDALNFDPAGIRHMIDVGYGIP